MMKKDSSLKKILIDTPIPNWVVFAVIVGIII